MAKMHKIEPAGSFQILEMDYLLLSSIIFHVFCCPFTKVEESFNMQAMHDMLELYPLVDFDHLEFPGVVPRTFLGAIAVSILSYPFHGVAKLLFGCGKLYSQYICRIVLGVISWQAFVSFRKSISFKFGVRAGALTSLLAALQFHLPFYMSRTLPNTFALIACLHAYSAWISGFNLKSLLIVAISMAIFRCDMLVLLAPLTLQMLIAQEIPFWRTGLIGVFTTFLAICLSVLVDSFFWRRLLWPEGYVLLFNTVDNKSSEWGVMPWHWYFTNALPKSLNLCILLAVAGLLGFKNPNPNPIRDKTSIQPDGESILGVVKLCFGGVDYTLLYYVFPVICFVCLYSILPHKELRFIFPALPILTMAAAVALDKLLPPASKYSKPSLSSSLLVKLINTIIHMGVLLILVGMTCVCGVCCVASYHNYPGGVALTHLLRHHIPDQVANASCLLNDGSQLNVHIDVAAAMTGVTRFGQEQLYPWTYATIEYSKTENLTSFDTFDWLLTDDPKSHGKSNNFEVREEIKSFKSLRHTISRNLKVDLGYNLQPAIYILKNKRKDIC